MRPAGYSLLNFLTSSHSHRCLRTEIPRYPYSWCLQETAVTVNVEIGWFPLSLGRRRLRFSFQFNDVKDLDRLSSAPLFSAGGRRRRLSSDRPLWCQSCFSAFATIPRTSWIRPQKSPRAAEGLPSRVRSDSIEARDNTESETNIKHLSELGVRLDLQLVPSGRRYLVAVPLSVNQSLFRGYPADLRTNRIFGPGLAFMARSFRSNTMSARLSTSRGTSTSEEFSKTCVSSILAFAARPKRRRVSIRGWARRQPLNEKNPACVTGLARRCVALRLRALAPTVWFRRR